MGAQRGCRGQQHRSQWTIIHSLGNRDGQNDYMQHKTHLRDTDNAEQCL